MTARGPRRLGHSSLPSVSAFPSPSPSLSGSLLPFGPPSPPFATHESVLLSSFSPGGHLQELPLPLKDEPSGHWHWNCPPVNTRTEWSGQSQPFVFPALSVWQWAGRYCEEAD